ncbi:MAG: hypothetical protein AB7U73_16470 [Pirellulales bacterium]
MRLAMYALAVVMAAVVMTTATVDEAQARPPYKKEFDALYLKKDSKDPAEMALAAAIEKVKCNVCHEGKSKKMRNDYGMALSKLLTKDDAKDVDKIKASIEKVADEHSDPNDDKSPTFGQLLKEGKLPGGEPDEETASAGE